MKSWNSGEKEEPDGNLGGSSFTTCLSCSKGFDQRAYGNSPVASSTNEIPRDQTSERISYCEGFPFGSILSG